MQAIKETVNTKSARLAATGRVNWLTPTTCEVVGDHSTYAVTHVDGAWTCSCRWYQHTQRPTCSHIAAAQQGVA